MLDDILVEYIFFSLIYRIRRLFGKTVTFYFFCEKLFLRFAVLLLVLFLEASVLAASTVNCTLDVCELTIPPAYAEVPIPSNNNKGKNFFIGKSTY